MTSTKLPAPATKRLARWFDRRLGAADFVRTALNKVFPDHWSFMLGEIALYSFLILVLTGQSPSRAGWYRVRSSAVTTEATKSR